MAKKIALLNNSSQYTPYLPKIYSSINNTYNWNNYKTYARIGNEWKLCSYETTQNQTITHSYPVLYNENGHGAPPASQTKIENVTLKLQPFISTVTEGEGTQTFTVYANANGGTWSGSNGSATYSPISHTYTQTAWYTNSSGTGGTSYASQANYTVNAPITLYAIWNHTQGSVSYTYTLPTGTPEKIATTNTRLITYNYGENASGDRYNDQSIQTTSYSFKGWYTAASGGTQRTTNSQITSDETVYAQYNTTTGSWSSIILPLASECHKVGYTLLGFSTTSEATAITSGLTPGASYTPTGNITLYAVWQQSSQTTYTVSYNRNGHGGAAPASQTKIKNQSLILRPFMDSSLEGGTTSNYVITGNANGGTWTGNNGSASYTTSQINYIQTAWNTNSGGTGTSYGDQAVYTANAAATLYAKWSSSQVSSASYTYSLPSGTPTKASVNTFTKTIVINLKGGTYNNSTTNPSFTSVQRTNYTFEGWYTAASGGTQRTTESQVTASETVYAHYIGVLESTYTSITLPTNITRNSYQFLGYDTSSNATTVVYTPGDLYTPSGLTGTVTLYCVWEPIVDTYLIQYNANGHGIAPNSQTKVKDENLTLRPFIGNVAEGSLVHNYVITGNANGGTWNGNNGSATWTEEGDNYVQTTWNTIADGSGDGYTSEGIYVNNAAATMYAQWDVNIQPESYTYTLPSGEPYKPDTASTDFVYLTINANGALFTNGSNTKTWSRQTGGTSYLFDGWYTAATGGTRRTSNSQVQADETVYAHYLELSIVHPVIINDSIVLPTQSDFYYGTEHVLNGFTISTDPSSTNVWYNPGDNFPVPTGNISITLYAIWDYEATITQTFTIAPASVSENSSGGGITPINSGMAEINVVPGGGSSGITGPTYGPYTYEVGMTFNEWVNSAYNTDGWYISGTQIRKWYPDLGTIHTGYNYIRHYPTSAISQTRLNTTTSNKTDVITNNVNYVYDRYMTSGGGNPTE